MCFLSYVYVCIFLCYKVIVVHQRERNPNYAVAMARTAIVEIQHISQSIYTHIVSSSYGLYRGCFKRGWAVIFSTYFP